MVVISQKTSKSRDSMFREFTKMFIDGKVVDEIRARMYYKRPSQVKKEEKIEQRKNRHKRR
ncbi:30S ribosomal protein S21 [Candidatus Roizmanbacteria bacterium CG11_big_fil_rev_8_21_14_0_20_36_8]|uniref:Small ribosomal subunit protein bS21 n=2 Tax=Candidatus Roizmaniibacteriota TaxID=1752723 RepID=A0A2M6IUE3_9BACT|nr:MAG: 30S ribosomal protein S21 [Candidatus Roizmanbacteria bacterium CG11_big_fil_rev_8_21_14_0_20_36_8]PIZ65830.1 MAG: 30S ribosomal protein S21 [Candidatus Roizmanbacteria bacterium CG_4_10_14_0_2_um_filter_36_9]